MLMFCANRLLPEERVSALRPFYELGHWHDAFARCECLPVTTTSAVWSQACEVFRLLAMPCWGLPCVVALGAEA